MSKVPLPKVLAEDFTSTEFDSAAQKAAFLKRLCRWIVDGMPKEEFVRTNKPLYYHLSLHFGHIAHYNRFGFWETWFSTPQARYEFLLEHLRPRYPGLPQYTWVDVENVLGDWIRNSGILQIYEKAAREWVEQESIKTARAALAHLSPEQKAQILEEAFNG